MEKKCYQLLILTLMGILMYSCQNKIEVTAQPKLTLSEELASESDGQIVLGEKLENPYSVKNMQLALKSLKEKQKKSSKSYSAKTLNDDLDIQVTDYYVKFWVKNDEQKNLLIADSLNLSIIPLDVEIEQEGDYFVDENTDIEQAQWLYTSVVKDYKFHSEVVYEKIEDLFLIEESGPEEEEGDEEEDETTTTTLLREKVLFQKVFFLIWKTKHYRLQTIGKSPKMNKISKMAYLLEEVKEDPKAI